MGFVQTAEQLIATGLLVLLAGRGTRLLQFVPSEPKVYEATIRFGQETDTDDATGHVVREAPLPPAEAVRAALPSLTGELEQLPPAYSAKHVAGNNGEGCRRGQSCLEEIPTAEGLFFFHDALTVF